MLNILLWPFQLVGFLMRLVLGAVGRLMTFVIGLAILLVGIVLCATVIGLLIGVPLCLLGGSMMLRSLF